MCRDLLPTLISISDGWFLTMICLTGCSVPPWPALSRFHTGWSSINRSDAKKTIRSPGLRYLPDLLWLFYRLLLNCYFSVKRFSPLSCDFFDFTLEIIINTNNKIKIHWVTENKQLLPISSSIKTISISLGGTPKFSSIFVFFHISIKLFFFSHFSLIAIYLCLVPTSVYKYKALAVFPWSCLILWSFFYWQAINFILECLGVKLLILGNNSP